MFSFDIVILVGFYARYCKVTVLYTYLPGFRAGSINNLMSTTCQHRVNTVSTPCRNSDNGPYALFDRVALICDVIISSLSANPERGSLQARLELGVVLETLVHFSTRNFGAKVGTYGN